MSMKMIQWIFLIHSSIEEGRKRRRCGAVLLVLWCCATLAPVLARGENRFSLVPDETRIEFTLGATLHTVYGRARLLSGEVRFDERTGALKGAVRIDARTMTTDNQVRDEKMHREVLETHLFAEVIFRPKKLALLPEEASARPTRPSGGRRKTTNSKETSARGPRYFSGQLLGTLEIHGSRHQLKFPVDISIQATRIHLEAHFTIPYVQWGMRDPSVFVLRVDKTVAVSINAIGILDGPLPTMPWPTDGSASPGKPNFQTNNPTRQ